MTLYEQAQEYRARLASADKRAASTLIRSYQTAYERIAREIEAVGAEIRRLRDAGVDPKEWQWRLTRQRRLEQLASSVRTQIGQYGQRAHIIIGGSIDAVALSAVEDSVRLLETALPDGIAVSPSGTGGPLAWAPGEAQVPGLALQQVASMTQPGGALDRLLAPLGESAVRGVEKALTEGIAIGENPRRIARRMKNSLGGNLQRSLTISRTETLRAYREVSRLTYAEYPNLVTGWQWVAACDLTTCPACWARHGMKFPVSTPMPAHPNCRCTIAPATPSWSELGFGSTPQDVRIPSGPQLFRKLSRADQERVLGKAKAAACRSNRIKLEDVAVTRQNPTWGASTEVASLSRATQNAAIRRGR